MADVDIDVVKTCSWVFPQAMDGVHVQKELYRSPELNNVMQTHKRNPQEVDRFYRENDVKEGLKFKGSTEGGRSEGSEKLSSSSPSLQSKDVRPIL